MNKQESPVKKASKIIELEERVRRMERDLTTLAKNHEEMMKILGNFVLPDPDPESKIKFGTTVTLPF